MIMAAAYAPPTQESVHRCVGWSWVCGVFLFTTHDLVSSLASSHLDTVPDIALDRIVYYSCFLFSDFTPPFCFLLTSIATAFIIYFVMPTYPVVC